MHLQNDDVQDSDTRWDQAPLAASEIPTEMVLHGLYKSKLQDSVQRQTVLAMYQQENIRNNKQPSFSRLKTSARLHIDQTMRKRNFRTQNETIERGAATKSQKGKKASAERKVENAISGKQLDSVQKETLAVSVIIPHLETDAIRDEKSKRPLLYQKLRHRLTERYSQKVQEVEEESPLRTRGRIPCRDSLRESVRIRHAIFGTLPCVSITSLNQTC